MRRPPAWHIPLQSPLDISCPFLPLLLCSEDLFRFSCRFSCCCFRRVLLDLKTGRHHSLLWLFGGFACVSACVSAFFLF